MKRVLLIGDSIRLGYQDDVIKELEGEYEVWGTSENNRFAKYTLNELGRIFAAFSKTSYEKKDEALLQPTESGGEDLVYPDIIHWNTGLWDTAIVCEEDGAFTPVQEYINYMSKILRELLKVTDKVVFATTTPVKPKNPNQKNEYIKEHNEAIVKFMEEKGIVINDLYSLVNSDVDRYLSEDNIHLSDEGKKICAKKIAEEIRKIDK